MMRNAKLKKVSAALVITAAWWPVLVSGAAPATQPSTRPAPQTISPRLNTSVENDLTGMSLEDLMDVEVTSVSKKKQSISQAPAAVAVVSQEDIRRSGFSTIPDLLRMVPSTDVARINSHTWAVGVRGLNDQFNNNLLVLQDGRSLYNPFYGGVYWDTVDYVLEDIDRIEVIRGPGATLWGANAVNGVINITSKDSRETQGWLVSTRGSNDDSNLSLRYGGKISDDTTYRAYMKTRYFNELDDTNGSNMGDDWSSLQGGFRLDKHPDDRNTVTLQGDVNGNRIQMPFNSPFTPIPVTTFTTRNDVSGNLLTRWDHRINDDSDFSFQVYYDYLKVKYVSTNYDQNTLDLDFHHRFKLGSRNEIIWGLGYRVVSSHVKDTGQLSASPPTKNSNLFSGFVQDTFSLYPDHLFFTLGSKLEHNDFTGFEVQPSARLLWTPDKRHSVWGAISRAVRTPTRLDDDAQAIVASTFLPVNGNLVPAQISVSGNPDEKSAKLLAYELGYRFQPRNEISIDVAGFYNTYKDMLSVSNPTPVFGQEVTLPAQFGNDIDGYTIGGEIAATVQVTDRWRLIGSYSLQKSDYHPTAPVQPTSLGFFNDSSPMHQAQLRSYFDITRHLQLNAGVYYVAEVSEFSVPAYVSTDVNLVWQPKESLRLSVGVMNLFDNHHPEFGTTGGQGVAAETPRTLYVQMSYQF